MLDGAFPNYFVPIQSSHFRRTEKWKQNRIRRCEGMVSMGHKRRHLSRTRLSGECCPGQTEQTAMWRNPGRRLEKVGLG